MKHAMRRMGAALLIALLAAPMGARGGSVVLKKAWVEKYKNRATIEVKLTIDKSHKYPNSIKDDGDDGDLHMAGRAPLAGLPMVAEIMNAKGQPAALNLVKVKKGKEEGVRLVGAWRLWFEHPPNEEQEQFTTVLPPEDSNPPHVFEIHPISVIESHNIQGSFARIPGFRAYDAQTAFPYFENKKVIVQTTDSGVRLISTKAQYNYVEFRIELTQKPVKRADGYMVLAIVKDAEGNPAAPGPRRMVFVAGTEPADKVKTLEKGGKMRVLGIPRINLFEIAKIAKTAGPHGIERNLPYEMIIVGHFPEE